MAQILSPVVTRGFDLYTVKRGSTSIDLSAIFPGAGTVYSDGVPVNPEGGLAHTSTAIERTGALRDGSSGVVPIEMFLENSVSVKPVDRSLFGLGEGQADFHTIINRGGIVPGLPNTDGLVRPSVGSMAIRRTGKGGGTFELMLNVNPLIVLTVVGGSVSDLNGPDVLLVIDGTGLLNPVGSVGGQWAATSPQITALRNASFPVGGFVAGADSTTGAPIEVGLTSGGVDARRVVTVS
jgi:hypothetical protein